MVANNNFRMSAAAFQHRKCHTGLCRAHPGFERLSRQPQILVVWNAPFNSTSVDIYVSVCGNVGKYREHLDGKIPERYFWYDNSTTNGNKYYYTVRANMSNVFVFSNKANATPFAGSPPAAITNLIATPDESNVGLYAKLATSTDVLIGYHIYRGNTSGSEAAVPIVNGTLIGTIALSSLNNLHSE